MDGAGGQLLAGARLPRHQHGAARLRDRLDQVEDRQHRLAAAEDVRELVPFAERPLEQDVLALQLAAFERAMDHDLQLVDVEGLVDVVVGAHAQRFDRRLGRGERGDHDPGQVGVHPLRRAQHVEAGHVGHVDVGDQQVDRPPFQLVEGLAAVLGHHHLVAFATEHDRQQFPHRALVVDDQDARGAGAGWRLVGGSVPCVEIDLLSQGSPSPR
jgi:hypothetical protein